MKVAHASSYARFERRVLIDPMASLERPSRMRERGRGSMLPSRQEDKCTLRWALPLALPHPSRRRRGRKPKGTYGSATLGMRRAQRAVTPADGTTPEEIRQAPTMSSPPAAVPSRGV